MVFKVFYNNEAVYSKDDSVLNEFISSTVIPDLNSDFEGWTAFERMSLDEDWYNLRGEVMNKWIEDNETVMRVGNLFNMK